MIEFHAISDLSATKLSGDSKNIGESVGDLNWGLQPTFGMTAEDMGVSSIVIKFTWSD